VLGEFFLSTSDGLDNELITSGPSGRLACVTAKGLTPVNIAWLGAMLGVGSYEEIFAECGAEHHEAESGESGVWDVPAAVCQALVTIDSLEAVAQQWVATEELRLDGWRASDGFSVLTELSALVSRQKGGQVLWYWWSL
jgi:hypothetical protein